MIYAKKLPSGELVNISHREQTTWDDGSVDVPLDAMPEGFGPFTHDEVNRVAVPPTADEVGKRKRKDVVDSLVAGDPMMGLILRVIKKLHKEIADLKKASGKSVRTFAEWQAETIDEFINDA